jgi:hypothetical protein
MTTMGDPGVITGINLPDLRVVALADVVLHEGTDDRRVSALTQRLQADGMIRNPPIVAPLDERRFVVLDGANRTTALRRIGVPDIVVQVVDYERVTLSTWFHLVTGAQAERLLREVQQVLGLAVDAASLAGARAALEAGTAIAYLVMPDGDVFSLSGGDGLAARTALLREAVAVYKGRANIHRVQTDDIASLRPFYDEIAGLVVFPSYRPADILSLAQQALKLPTGITRHVIPLRALRTNTELTFLWSDQQLSEKNRWLADWTRHKLQGREIRVYEEATVLYDE